MWVRAWLANIFGRGLLILNNDDDNNTNNNINDEGDDRKKLEHLSIWKLSYAHTDARDFIIYIHCCSCHCFTFLVLVHGVKQPIRYFSGLWHLVAIFQKNVKSQIVAHWQQHQSRCAKLAWASVCRSQFLDMANFFIPSDFSVYSTSDYDYDYYFYLFSWASFWSIVCENMCSFSKCTNTFSIINEWHIMEFTMTTWMMVMMMRKCFIMFAHSIYDICNNLCALCIWISATDKGVVIVL